MSCEHYLNLCDEEWLSENEVSVTVECSECKAKFMGVLKEL